MQQIARLGGLSLLEKEAPLSCPRPGCDKQFPFCTPWHSFLGHLGLHGLADRYFGGDIRAAQKRLRQNGQARQEAGASWQNGAFPPYRPIK